MSQSYEERCAYALLKHKHHDIITQYSSDKYPFNCDFFVPSLDLYIEYNGSQYHGGHPFDADNDDDIKQLDHLRLLSEQSERHSENKRSQYDAIIDTWTIRDVNKRNIASINNVNLLELWSIDDVKNYVSDILSIDEMHSIIYNIDKEEHIESSIIIDDDLFLSDFGDYIKNKK